MQVVGDIFIYQVLVIVRMLLHILQKLLNTERTQQDILGTDQIVFIEQG